MTYVTWKYANCDQSKVIGAGTLLDTARLRYILSQKYNKPINEVTGYVLGEHGDSRIYSLVYCKSWKITRISNEYDFRRSEKAGFEVSKSQGFTCYGIASALTRITRAILFDENSILPVSSYLDKYGIFISTPSIIGKNGVINSNVIDLDKDELESLENSVRFIKTAIGNL